MRCMGFESFIHLASLGYDDHVKFSLAGSSFLGAKYACRNLTKTSERIKIDRYNKLRVNVFT